MPRITVKTLQELADMLNEITGSPKESYAKDENGNYRANIGNFHVDGAYGGFCFHRMVTDGGGVDTPIFSGHRSAREAYDMAYAYARGYQDAKRG